MKHKACKVIFQSCWGDQVLCQNLFPKIACAIDEVIPNSTIIPMRRKTSLKDNQQNKKIETSKKCEGEKEGTEKLEGKVGCVECKNCLALRIA